MNFNKYNEETKNALVIDFLKLSLKKTDYLN